LTRTACDYRQRHALLAIRLFAGMEANRGKPDGGQMKTGTGSATGCILAINDNILLAVTVPVFIWAGAAERASPLDGWWIVAQNEVA